METGSTPRTLRQWAGLSAPTELTASRTALVLIDLQQDYFSGKLPLPAGEAAMEQAARLLAWAREHDLLVAHIQQCSAAGAPLFASDSPLVAIHPAVAPRPGEPVVVKHFPSSFDRTDLHERLQARGIDTLVLGGLMTHMCVSTTARAALPYGYRVLLAADACATRDLPAPDGTIVPHHLVHQVTLAALADRFVDVMDVARICELPVR